MFDNDPLKMFSMYTHIGLHFLGSVGISNTAMNHIIATYANYADDIDGDYNYRTDGRCNVNNIHQVPEEICRYIIDKTNYFKMTDNEIKRQVNDRYSDYLSQKNLKFDELRKNTKIGNSNSHRLECVINYRMFEWEQNSKKNSAPPNVYDDCTDIAFVKSKKIKLEPL